MRLMFITGTFLLLLISPEAGAKAVSKRHVRRDWLILPDTVTFWIYESVNKVSPSTGKFLMDIFETPLVQNTRSLLIKQTSQLSLKAEDLYNKIVELWQKKEKSEN
ncbi:apovitellenin-1-like [Spea bombifrons]|uniref:apovitellenin-1-like n=1 Tax=Spea bombifrons TaxID=233779 RepID=UPI00234B6D0A|nr:apovitellenin-1-like [Spea bombifrons]